MMAFRICVAMLLSGLSTSVVMAQGQPSRNTGVPRPAPTGRPQIPSVQRGEQPRQERPQPARTNPGQDQRVVPVAGVEAPTPLPPLTSLDPQLLEVLKEWADSSAKIKELRGTHVRYVFDEVFSTEKRSKGNFYYVEPDKGRIDLEPLKVGTSDKPRKAGFTVQPENPERWICDGYKIYLINDASKEYDVFDLPLELRGENIINGPLPFLFGMSPENAHRRFELKLLKNTATDATILAMPRLKSDQANYKEARIILRKDIYMPKAVRLLDPAETRVTEYWFDDLEPNGAGVKAAMRKLMGEDPFHPNLSSYKVAQTAAGTASGGAVTPAGGRPAPRAVKATAEGTGRARLE